MVAGLKFMKEFFTKQKYEMENITITLEERPSFDIRTEDYRFRIKISEVVDEIDICCRDLAIEDHHQQLKHQQPHLQFKLHADGVGHIHILLPVETIQDYKRYILSFLDLIGSIILEMDNPQKELENYFMVMANFKKIEGMQDNIKRLILEQYKLGGLRLLTLEKEEREICQEDIEKIKKIPQIAPFFQKIWKY